MQVAEHPRAALKRDELEVAARWLADAFECHGAPRGSFAIALGDGELHVYAGCSEVQWTFSKPPSVGGTPVEWHFGSVGMVSACEHVMAEAS